MANAELHAATIESALAEAAQLTAAGDLVAAIRALTAANRAHRDKRIEERLVTLRHEASATLATPDEAPPWVPVTAAPSGGASLDEIGPEELTVAALRAGLARQGCVVVRGLVPAAEAAELAAGIDRTLDAFDAAMAGAPVHETSPWYVPFAPTEGTYRVGGRRNWVRASGGVWAVDSPRMLFELTELLGRTGVGSIVAEHLGERPVLSANKCTLRRVPTTSSTEWHQDGAFLGADVRTVNLWLSLSDCGVDAPGLDIVPRRFDDVLATGGDGALFDWSVSPAEVERQAHGTPVLRPRFAPGDALLFDHLFLHRTAVDPAMSRERHAIETWMFAPSTYPGGQIPVVY